jgi:hypothetical protein
MVINSTNINKTKESLNIDGQQLNSDGQQLKEFQQSKPLILTELTEHKTNPQHMTLEIQTLTWDRNNMWRG